MTPTHEHRPLRVLHLTAGSDAGGLSRYIFDLCSAMHADGHEVAVAGEVGAWHSLFATAPFPWIEVPFKGGPVALWKSARTLLDWLARHPVDIMHSHYRRPTLVARRIQRQLELPILYTVHLTDISLAWPRRMFSDFGDHTHVASSEARRWVIEEAGVPAERVALIHHGIDAARFPRADEPAKRAARRALGIANDDIRVAAFVGRLDIPKNEQWLLDVALRSPQTRLLIAGEGPHEAAMRARVARDRLVERVHLLGNRDPLPVYQAADALLLPSAREGFSLVCAEAMCVGVPVLRTRTAGTRELIIEGVTGRSVPINRELFIAEAIDFLRDLPALRRMGAAAADHVRNNFTFDLQFARTVELYRSMACRR